MVNENKKRDPNEEIIFHEEIQSDMRRLKENIISNANVNEDGFPISRCENLLFQIPTRPKTLLKKQGQAEIRQIYKDNLRKEFEKRKQILDIIKNKRMLLYMIAYLLPKNYNSYDVGNIPYHFCNVLEDYVGDDVLIQTLITEKIEVKSNPPEAETPEECEEFLVFIAHESYKKYLFA